MSTFVVRDETINRVVTWLSGTGQKFGCYLSPLGYYVTDKALLTELAKEMFNLNVEAVNQRYGDGEAATFRPLDFQYRCTPPATTFQVLKNLHCWLYQCHEGSIPEDELYLAFERVHNGLAHDIVSQLPEYKAAKWDA